MLSFWAESSLFLENVKFVKGADNSFGIYEPRENDVFTAGEPIYLYMEPAGYVMKKNPAGYYEFGFKADFQVADESGKVLGGQTISPFCLSNPGTPTRRSRSPSPTPSAALEKGKYKIITQVSDMHSAKKASCEKWLTIK